MADDYDMNDEQMEPEKKYSFLKETFKDEELTGKRIIRSILQLVGRGLIFGVAACIAFCVLKPVFENHLSNENTEITISKDEEVSVEQEETGAEEAPVFTVDNYREMNEALNEITQASRKCVVEVRSKSKSADWTEGEEAIVSVSGMIVWDNGTELLILAPYGELPEENEYLVKFVNGQEHKAHVRSMDSNMEFRILGVWKSELSKDTLKRVMVAELGNSNLLHKGSSVISIGNQFGYSDGVGYGVISSKEHKINLVDYQYRLLTTDIAMASGGSGILFNIDGQVVGIIDHRTKEAINADVVSAYAISQIKEVIELLTNRKEIPYLGITGIEVTEDISQSEGIPIGVYVKEVEADSPAMLGGIQAGDIIVQMDSTEISTLGMYSNVLMDHVKGEVIPVKVKRLGVEEYENVLFDVTVGVKE